MQLRDLKETVSTKELLLAEKLKKRLQRAINQLEPQDDTPTNNLPRHRTPEDDDNTEQGGNLAGSELLVQ